MAFNGNLIMVGSYVIPNKYIKYDSWKSTWETLDFDTYRDIISEVLQAVSMLCSFPATLNYADLC